MTGPALWTDVFPGPFHSATQTKQHQLPHKRQDTALQEQSAFISLLKPEPFVIHQLSLFDYHI